MQRVYPYVCSATRFFFNLDIITLVFDASSPRFLPAGSFGELTEATTTMNAARVTREKEDITRLSFFRETRETEEGPESPFSGTPGAGGRR